MFLAFSREFKIHIHSRSMGGSIYYDNMCDKRKSNYMNGNRKRTCANNSNRWMGIVDNRD